MKRTILIIVIITLFLSGIAMAQFSKRGTSGIQFLKIGVGARAQGMAGAFTAVANDASALYWNPAGITQIPNMELIFSFSDWISDVNHAFFGFVYNAGSLGCLGFSFTSLTMGEMEITTLDEPQGTGNYFNASDVAVGLTYARAMTDRFSFGIKLKYVNESIWDMNANGFAFDIGTIYSIGLGGLKIAMNMANFGPELRFSGPGLLRQYNAYPEAGNVAPIDVNLDTDYVPLPMTFRFGLSYDWDPFGDAINMTECLEFVKTNDRAEAVIVAAEAAMMNMLYLRAGFNAVQEEEREEGFSAGIGIKFNYGNYKGSFDFSYTDLGRLESVNRFSLGFSF